MKCWICEKKQALPDDICCEDCAPAVDAEGEKEAQAERKQWEKLWDNPLTPK